MEKEITNAILDNKATQLAQEQVRYKSFVKWCLDNGMKWTGVDYPAIFQNGLRGMIATRDIKPYEGIIFVPNTMLISVKSCKEDPFLSKIISKYDEIFNSDEQGDYNVLILFLLRERMKGKHIKKLFTCLQLNYRH